MLDESIFKTAKLCVVGNINRDIKTTPITPEASLFNDGETSIAGIEETVGGGGANSAAIAARLGAQVSFIGQIGDDALGSRLERALQQSGVCCRLHRAPNLATGSTVNLVFDSGHRHFLSYHPNNAALSFEALDLSALRDAQHLLRADLWFSEAMLFGGNQKLFQLARAAGLAVSIDLNWDPKWGHAPLAQIEQRKQAVRALLPFVDLAHGNVRELNEFTGASDLNSSLSLLSDWGVRAVLVHLGKEGAGYYSNGELLTEKPSPVQRAVNTTGCGDVLSVCTILMHQVIGLPTQEKLRLANGIVAEFMEGRRALIPEL